MRSMRNVFSLDPVDAEAQRTAQPKPAPEPTFQRPDGGFDYLALSAEYKVPPNIIRATTELGGVDGKQAASVLADAMKRSGGDVPAAIKSILGDDAASQQLLDHAASIAQFPPVEQGRVGAGDTPSRRPNALVSGAVSSVGSAAEALGFDETADALGEYAASKAPKVSSYKDVDGFGDAVRYVGGSVLQSLPEMAAVAAVGAGVILSGGTALLAGGAALGTSALFNAGRAASRQEEETGDISYAKAWGAGLAMGALDAIVPGKVGGAIGSAFSARAAGAAAEAVARKSIGRDVLEGAVTEAATELGQFLIEIGQADPELLRVMFNPTPEELQKSDQLLTEAIDSVLAGGAAGGAFAGAGNLASRMAGKEDPEDPTEPAVDAEGGDDAPPMLPPPPLGLPAPDGEAVAPQGTIEQSVVEGDQEPEAGQMPMGGQPDTTSGVDLPQAPIDGGVPENVAPAPDLSRPPMGPLSMAASRIEAPANSAPPPKSRVRVTTPEGADLEAVFESEDADGLNLRFNNSPWRIPRQDIEAGTVAVTPIDPIREDVDRRTEEARQEIEKVKPVEPVVAQDEGIPDDMFPVSTAKTNSDIAGLEIEVGGKRYPVSSYEDASKKYRAAIDAGGFGVSGTQGGNIYQGGVQVARVSYNGRVWTPDDPITRTGTLLFDPVDPNDAATRADMVAQPGKIADDLSVITKDGKPFKNPVAARKHIVSMGQKVEDYDIEKAEGFGYIARRKGTVSEIEAAALATDENPTEAQKEAENYRTGKVGWKGLRLSIENRKGSERSKKTPDGKTDWSVTMPAHYGRILRTTGADGDHVDFYMGDQPDAEAVWVIDQVDAETGAWDEHKVMLGFDGAAQARQTYEAGFSDGKGAQRLGGIKKMSLVQFKTWLKDGDTTKPLSRKVLMNSGKADTVFPDKTGGADGREASRSQQDGRVSDLEGDQDAMPQPEQLGAQELRRSGNNDTPIPREQLSGISGRGRTSAQPEALDRTEEQQQGVRAGQPDLGDEGGAGSEQAQQSASDGERSDANNKPVGRGDRAYPERDQAAAQARGNGGRGSAGSSDGAPRTPSKSEDKNRREDGEYQDLGPDVGDRRVDNQGPPKVGVAARETAGKTPPKVEGTTDASGDVRSPGVVTAKPSILSALSDDKQARAAELKRRIADKVRNQTSSGLDPEYITLGSELVALYVEAGTKRFAAILSDFIEATGLTPREAQAPMRAAYNFQRDEMEIAGQDIDGMDSAVEVMAEVRRAIADTSTLDPVADIVSSADNETNEAADNDTESKPLRVDPSETLEGLAPDSLQGNEGGRDAEPDGTADRPLDSRQRTEDDGAGDAGGRGRGSRSGRAVSRPRKKPVNDSQPALDFAAAQSEQIADTSRQNFRITKDLRLGQGGPTEKFNDNVAAIETLKRIEAENRPATPTEQAILARYVGWGGLKNAFRVQGAGDVSKGWEDKVAQIEALLEPEELKAARNSTRAAHYTSETIVTGIWKLAERLGFAGGAVLEPSAGTGNFLGLMPDSARGNSKVMAVEYDSITARIAKQLYPQAAVYHTGFQNVPLPEGQFSLAIGNPPFGTDSLFFQHLPEMNRKSIHNQFFGASLHALAPDGLLTMVVSRYLMDAQDRSNRVMMARKGELVGAIRLPSSAFQENARTEVVTDILAFRRHSVPQEIVDAALARIEGVKGPEFDAQYIADVDRLEANFRKWLDVSKFEDPAGSGEVMSMNDYFHQNKRLVLGDIAATGTMRRKNELNVTLPAADIAQRLDIAINSIPAAAPRDTIATRTAERFETLAKAMEMAVRGVEPGSVTLSPDGKLMAALEQVDADDNVILAEVEITADTPYPSAYFLGTDGKWRRETDVLDDKGKPVKVKTPEGKVTARNEKQIEVITNPDSIAAAAKWGAKRVEQLRDMLPIRDAFRRQVQLESEPEATKARVEENRKKLKAAYDAFKKAHGPLHQPRVRAIADGMPDGGLVLAVEDIVSKPGAPLKVQDADILSKRVLLPPAKVTKADSVADAISISLSETGGLDMQRMADLLATDIPAIEKALSAGETPRGFFDPEQSKWVTADEYLSGEVRRKLAAAELENLEANVKALEKVAPEPWGPAEITPSMGANWIPPEVYGDFLRHIGFDSGRVRYQALTNTYYVEAMGKAGAEWSTTESRAWSTDKIIETVMNSGPIKVTYTIRDGDSEKTVVDEDATRESQEKAEELQNEFQDWVFTEDNRRDKLVQIFNNKYNTRVTRQRDGSHLSLPGKNPAIIMRRHQNNAIWRGITDSVVLYDHVVGAGKTYTAIARIMERRRMGLTRKPMVVVPNHLTEQWGADWKKLYPGAKLLVAGKADFTKANRRRMFARIAAGDYDGVIIGHSQIGMISIDPSIEIGYLEQELKDAMKAIKDAEEQAREDGTDQGWRKPVGVAEAERMANKLEERMQRVRAKSRDKLITFQQMGVDDLTIDEAHEFKNLAYSSRMTNTAGMGNKAGSQKALDLHMKMRAMHDAVNSSAFLTGTPISNSVAEMYLVLRNLVPNQLREMGLENFDAWRTMFVTASSEWEPTEAGGLKEVVRLGREWTNMRTLMDLYYSVSDAVTIDDIKRDYPIDNDGKEFPIPRVKNVKEGETRRLVAVTPGPATASILDEVVRGFDSLPNISNPKERNIERLKLMDKARKIALDPRAVDPANPADPEGGKIAAVVGEVTRIHREWDADKGTQIVFLDRSVPKAKGDEKIVAEYDAAMDKYMQAQQDRDEAKIAAAIEALDKFDANDIAARRNALAGGWNAYDDIKARLIENGIPAEEIAFVQEANNDTQKAQLFARVKAGEVRILIGSTPRMGAGTNVQDRLVALHHVDVTWKPSDIEQREGRIIRQGNQLLDKYGMEEFGVEVIAYATERTVDAKMWDLNGQKLKAINGIRKYDGSFSMEFEDADSASMAEMAALATGNTLMVDRIKLEGARKKLMGKQRTFNKRRNAMRAELQQARRAVAELPGEIAQSKRLLPEVEKQLDAVKANTDARSIVIDGTTYQTADEAEAGLTAIIEAQQGDTKKRWKAKIGDLDVTTRDDASKLIRKAFGTPGFKATIAGVDHIDIQEATRALHDAYTKVKTEQADLDTKTFSDAEINGFPVDLVVAPGYGGTGTQLEVSLMFDGEPAFTGYRYDRDGKFSVNMMRVILGDIVAMTDPRRVDRRIRSKEQGLEDASKRITALEREVTRDFPAAAELQGVTEQLDAVIAALGAGGSKDDAKASYGEPTSRPVVATLTGRELPSAGDMRALRSAAVAWYRQTLGGKKVYSAALGAEVQFSRKGANKSVNMKGEDLVRIIPALREIIASGQLVRSQKPRKDRAEILGVHTIAARVMLGGKPKDVVVLVRETAEGRFHYDLSRDMSGGARFQISDPVPAQLQTASVEADTATLNISIENPDVNFSDAAAAIEQALTEAGIAGKVTGEVVEGLAVAGRAAQGRYVAGGIAVDPASPDLIGTARHEVVHALRDPELWGKPYGLFSKEEWQTMVRAAQRDRALMDRIKATYKGQSARIQTEEAVAERYRRWVGSQDATGPLQRAFQRLRDALEAVANGLAGAGFQSEASVFRAVANGDVGLRGEDITPGTGSQDPRALLGFTPQSPFVTATGRKRGLKELAGSLVTKAMIGGSDGQYSGLALIPMRGLLAEMASPLAGARRYLSFKEKMDAMRNDLHNEMDAVAKSWRKILVKDKDANKAMMDLMHETTIKQIDPSQRFVGTAVPRDYDLAQKYRGTKTGDSAMERIREDQRRRELYRDLKARYDALPAEFRAMYRTIRDEYTKMADKFEKAILDNAQKAMDVGIRRAERAYTKRMQDIADKGLKGKARREAIAEARQELENAKASNRFAAQARLASLRATFESNRLQGPYFPLARFGKLFVTVRDELGQVISFSRFERQYGTKDDMGQMDFADQMRAAGYSVEIGTMAEFDASKVVDPSFVADIEELMGEIGASPQVMDEIWQRWLHSLPDMSVRTNRIHRKGTPGFAADAFRAFGYNMNHGAHQLARLTYGIDLQHALEDARDDARADPDPVRAGLIVNEMQKRHQHVMNPTSATWAYNLTTLAFVWYLSVTPAAAISNITQTTVVGIPILAADYGKGGIKRASAEITRAMGDFATGKGHATESNRLTGEEKTAMEEAYRRGIVDKSQAHDLTGVGETGAEYSRVRTAVMEKIAWFFHHAERMNREITFLAAYRLARERGMGQEQAIAKAGDLTWRAHFDYQASSRPRIMQDDWLRVFLVFKNFQTNMLWRLFRDIHQSVEGRSPELRAEARRQLVGITASMFLHAGFKGVWGYALLKTLLGMFLPGDGEEIEEEMEQALLAVLPNDMVAAFLHGVPGTLMGIDVTNRWGMPELWFRAPNRDMEGSSEYQYWVGELIGAVPGIAEGFFRGAQSMKDGEYWKGFENAVPKWMRDISKSIRYGSEGATTYNGSVIIDDFSMGELISQFSGFTPARLARQYELNARDKNAEQRIIKARGRTLRDVRKEVRTGNGISPATQRRIAEFNQEYPFYAITVATIMRSIKSGERSSQNTRGGVYINPKLAPYIDARRPVDLYD